MSGFDYTTTALLASIRRRAMIPTASATGTATSDLLAYADEETQQRLVPLILANQEEYFGTYSDTTLSSTTTSFRIPSRAIGGKLRQIHIVDSNGNITEVPRIGLEGLQDDTFGYYLQGNTVNLLSTSSVPSGTWRMYWYQRPSKLLDASAAGFSTVSAINTGTKTITTSSSIPGTFTTSVTYDLVRSKPGFECLAIDQAVGTASGTTLTFSSTLPTDLAVGDYVCLAGETPVPQVPHELHPVLAQAVAAKVLEAKGDVNGLQAAQAKLLEMQQAVEMVVSNRVDGAPKRIVNHFPLYNRLRSGW